MLRILRTACVAPIAALRYGAKVVPLLYPDLDNAKLEAEFAALAGPQAADELRAFATHPGIQKLRTLGAPVRKDELVDQIADAFDRHLKIARCLSIGADLYPIGSGKQELIELQGERFSPFSQYLDSIDQEDWFKRFLALSVHLQEAEKRVLEAAGMADVQTHPGFAGVADELRNACARLDPTPTP